LNAPNRNPAPQRDPLDEARIETRRYLAALRHSRLLIALIVLVITGTVVALSVALPKSYDASAKIVLNQTSGVLQAPDAESTQRTLATLQTLLDSRQVQERTARRVTGETADSIADKLESSVDADANVINIVATDERPEQATAIANSTADSFLEVQGGLQRKQVSSARQSLIDEIESLRDRPSAQGQIAALQRRIDALSVQEASAGSELQLAERADIPKNPARPRPVRNGILAFFASLFLGVLAALGRDQLRPRINDSRELARVLGLRVLAGVPYVRRGLGRRRRAGRAMEHEAYQALAAGLQLAVPARRRKPIVLVTSAVHAEGKTTVTAQLGRALARSGHRVLLVSGDLRWPTLHELFGLSQKPGLTDAWRLAERAGITDLLLPATVQSVTVGQNRGRTPAIQVLTSGSKAGDPGRMVASETMRELFDEVRQLDYDYCIVDAPPLLGIADVRALVPEVDHILLVTRLDRVMMDQVVATRESLDELDAECLGVVVIGSAVDVSPYYLSERSLFRGREDLGAGVS
jgi:capsular exopolysaccharide synthesis family protein